ncbi:MAG: glycosyltransferase 87 family protein [Stackebrandtia sp.]
MDLGGARDFQTEHGKAEEERIPGLYARRRQRRLGVPRPSSGSIRRPLKLDFAFYAISGAFAVYTVLWSTLPAHRFWGGIAAGAYLPAAVVTLMLLRQYAVPTITRLWIAVGAAAAAVVVPLGAEVAQRSAGVPGRAQEEVLVVEDSGRRLVDAGTPYLSVDAIAAMDDPLLGYNPYQPGMSVFGLPHAVFGDHWLADARIWFAAATLAALWGALRLLSRNGLSNAVRVRAIQGVAALPICALTLATGGDDLPVAALCLLALAAASADRPVAAGLAVGGAAALKLFAWPVLAVMLFLAFRKGQVARFAPPALALPLLTLTPTLLFTFDEFTANVVEFPLGLGVVTSPAASPLPGYLIASSVPAGPTIALVLLASAALAVGVYLLRRPPGSAHAASAVCAVGLSAAVVLMPASRFGYLLYPAVFGVWWWVLKQSESPSPEWGRHTAEVDDSGPASA